MKNARTPQGGIFFDSHCMYYQRLVKSSHFKTRNSLQSQTQCYGHCNDWRQWSKAFLCIATVTYRSQLCCWWRPVKCHTAVEFTFQLRKNSTISNLHFWIRTSLRTVSDKICYYKTTFKTVNQNVNWKRTRQFLIPRLSRTIHLHGS